MRLHTVNFSFVKRFGNRVADSLANIALNFKERYLINETPHQVDSLILSDVQSFSIGI